MSDLAGPPASIETRLRIGQRGSGNAVMVARAAGYAASLGPVIRAIEAEGRTSLNQIAAALNERGVPASRGGAWSATQVFRVLGRMNEVR